MKYFLIYICVLITIQHSFTSPTPPPSGLKDNFTASKIEPTPDSAKITNFSPSTDFASTPSFPEKSSQALKKGPSILANILLRRKGRNTQFGGPQDVLVLGPTQNSFDVSPDNERTVFEPAGAHYEPYPLNSDDNVDVGQMQYAPVMDNYPDDAGEEDLATASQIVFRPLFAYRRQTAQRRRVYSAPPSSASSSFPTSSGERRQQSYPYRYSSYGYPYYYPNYYNKWC